MSTPSLHRVSDLGLDHARMRILCAKIGCDPRSLIKEMRAARGETAHVRGSAGIRIREALIAEGLIAPAAAKTASEASGGTAG